MDLDLDNYYEEVEDCLERIRKWDNLTFMEKLARKERKPSAVDYRIVSTWMNHVDKKLKLEYDVLEVKNE